MRDAHTGDRATPDLNGLLRDTDEGFHLATSALGEVVEHFVIAGRPFRIRVAGPVLAGTLLPALGRCRRSPGCSGEAVTEFRAWDSVGSGVTPPRPPWSIDDYLPRDEVRGSGEQGIDASYALADRILSLWGRAEGRGRFWVNDAGALPIWEPSAPFRNLLHWSLADTGLAFAHAAVVGTPAGGVLLAGRGGAGKSTTAMVCVDAGWCYVADDYCVLDASGHPTAHALVRHGEDLAVGVGPASPPRASGAVAARRRQDRSRGWEVASGAPRRFASPACRRYSLGGRRHRRAPADVSRRRRARPRSEHPVSAPRGTAGLVGYHRRHPEAGPRLRVGGGSRLGRHSRRTAAGDRRSEDVTTGDLSIIVPAHNAAATLEAAIGSALEADGLLEVVVIDDGSTDDTLARANEMAAAMSAAGGPLLRVLSQPQAGPSAARNFGAANAKGGLLAFLDADDRWVAGVPDSRRRETEGRAHGRARD